MKLWIGLLLLAASLNAGPRHDAWRVLGPGGGGAMFHPTISPHNSRDLLVACDMTGAYISHDGGESWRMFNLRDVVRFFVFDPKDRNIIYAGTRVLWRSKDAGATWRVVWPAHIDRVEMSGDHADEMPVSGGDTPAILTATVDPADSRVLYAVMQRGGSASLEESRDSGSTWRTIGGPFERVGQIIVDPSSPRGNRTLYVLSNDAVVVRRSGEWRKPVAYGPFLDVSAGFSKGGNFVVYGVSKQGIRVSRDGGDTWMSGDLGGPATFRAIATSLGHAETAYVAYGGFDGGHFGVARTSDSGTTWKPVWKESGKDPANNVHDAWITESLGPDWAEQPLNLGVSPVDPELCIGTDFGRTMITRDGGRTWTAAYSRRVPGAGWTSTGLDVTTSHGVHLDPFDPRRIFIDDTDTGLLRSEDGGLSWMTSTAGVPHAWVNTTYWMTFDPDVKGRVWAVMSGTHDLPRPKMWRRNSPARYRGGVVVSDDGGKTWRTSSEGMPQTAPTHILLDPTSPKDSRILYVAAFGRGVYKSGDGGRSWSLKNEGLPGAEPFGWRIVRDGTGTLYLLLARHSEDGSIGNAMDGALYRSTDGADHWIRVQLPEGVNAPNGLAIDPLDPKRMYLAAWRRKGPDADGGGGVYLSTDAGTTWRHVLDRDQHVFDVTVDPRNPATLYACGFTSSAWRSTDRGVHWQRIRGYNFKWGQRVIPDPRDPSKIFISTFGGGVWYGPATGDPSATEDIAGPELAYPR